MTDPKQSQDQPELNDLAILRGDDGSAPARDVEAQPEPARKEPSPLEIEAALELSRKCLRLNAEQAEIREANALAAIVEEEAACLKHLAELLGHQAREAEHRASKEPERQEMTLKERNTTRIMAVIVTIFAMAILTAGVVVNPWLLPTGTLAGGIAFSTYNWRVSKNHSSVEQKSDEDGP